MDEARSTLLQLLASHETWRSHTINLIASENALSPAVRGVLNSDLVQRYGDYSGRDLSARHYRGNRFIEQIEREAVRIAQETFKAEYVELRPISGHVAGAAVLMGLCHTGDLVLEPGRDGGGHREGGKFASSAMAPVEVGYLPIDPVRYNIDMDRFSDLIHKRHPRVVIVGSSNFLFPHPVEEIASVLKTLSPETVLVYDGSHVMGFLASGAFQHPLEEGAGLVFGSTHKTLPGPQGGIIFSNRDDLMEKVCQATYPALITNHHLFRIPALALALLEMQHWGAAYTGQVTANAQALGAALAQKGIGCVNVDGLYTHSHTILACVSRFGKGAEMAARLETCGIITTAAHLPEYWGVEGLRLGTQEVTRLGATADDMQQIAALIEQALSQSRSPEAINADAANFADGLGPVHFTWPDETL